MQKSIESNTSFNHTLIFDLIFIKVFAFNLLKLSGPAYLRSDLKLQVILMIIVYIGSNAHSLYYTDISTQPVSHELYFKRAFILIKDCYRYQKLSKIFIHLSFIILCSFTSK